MLLEEKLRLWQSRIHSLNIVCAANSCALWTGFSGAERPALQSFAMSRGKVLLEMTPGGHYLDQGEGRDLLTRDFGTSFHPWKRFVWLMASTHFANMAVGSVEVYRNVLNPYRYSVHSEPSQLDLLRKILWDEMEELRYAPPSLAAPCVSSITIFDMSSPSTIVGTYKLMAGSVSH